jgi:hypothetical protein
MAQRHMCSSLLIEMCSSELVALLLLVGVMYQMVQHVMCSSFQLEMYSFYAG